MDDRFVLTAEQHKLLASALRIKILNMLDGLPRTAKQAADILGESPGNIHYHIQRLHDGGLLELTETREVGGIVEKYYKAVATRFRFPGEGPVDERARHLADMSTRLLLTAAEAKQLSAEIEGILEKWERLMLNSAPAERLEVAVQFVIDEVPTDETSPDSGEEA